MKPFYTIANKRPRKAVRFVQDGSWQVVLQPPFPSLPEDYKIYLRKQPSTGLYHARQTDDHLGTTYGTGTTPDSALVNLYQNLKAVNQLLDTTTTEWYGLPTAKKAGRITTVGKVFMVLGFCVLIAASIALHRLVYTLLLL